MPAAIGEHAQENLAKRVNKRSKKKTSSVGAAVKSTAGKKKVTFGPPAQPKGNYFTSKRYLEGGKSKTSTRRELWERRKRIGQMPGRTAQAMRIGRYDPKVHGVMDPVARDVRRVLSPNRSKAERTTALNNLKNLQAHGMVPGGKQPPKTDPKPLYTIGGDKVERGTGKIIKGKVEHGKFKPDGPSTGQRIDKYLEKSLKNDAKIVNTVIGGIKSIFQTGGEKPRGRVSRQAAGVADPFDIAGDAAKKTAKKGLAAAGGVIFEGFDRPVGAIESAIAKAAAEAGAFSPEKRARIKKARNPGEVLAHGRDWKKDVTGGDITEAVGVGRHLGVGADAALDPLSWLSVGLAPETGGASLAPLLAKIKKVAPGLLESPEAKAAFAAHKGNEKELHKALSKLMKGGKGSPLSKAKAQQAQDAIRTSQENATTLKVKTQAKTKKRGGTKSETFHIPTANEAVEAAYRSAEGRRVAPQLRLSVATPLGRRTRVGINLPTPARIPVLPMKAAARDKLYLVAGRKEVAIMEEKRRRVIEELEGRISAAQRSRNIPVADKLRSDLADYKRTAASYGQKEVMDIGRKIVGNRRAMRVEDLAKQRNDRLSVHTGRVAADEYGRTTQALFSKAGESASKILKGNPEEVSRKVQRVQFYRQAKAENLGGHEVAEAAIGKLTPDEAAYAKNLDNIDAALLDHGQKTGVIGKGVSDYVGMRLWDSLNSPQDVGNSISSAIKNHSSTTGYQRHRTVASVTDHASEAEIASAIQRLSDKPITEAAARDAARDLFLRGKRRATAELLMRRIERGEDVHWDDLTKLEQDAATWGAHQGFKTTKGGDPIPLFKTPHTDPEGTEGLVLLANPDRYHIASDLTNMSEGQRVLPELLSVKKDLQQVRAMRAGLAPDQTDLAADLAKMEERYATAADNADPGTVLNRQIEEVHRLLDENPEVLPDSLDPPTVGTNTGAYARKLARERGEEIPDTPEVTTQLGGRAALIPDKGGFTLRLDDKGNLWMRGPKNFDDPPIEGMPKRPAYEAGPLDDPFDYTSRLPDNRKEGAMVNLDPRVTGYLRSRSQGATSGYNARWQGIDRVHGRSTKEFDDRTVETPDGPVKHSDLIVERDTNGQVTGYTQRGDDGRSWDADEITFTEPTLIPNRDRSFWTDPSDGQEFVRPATVLPTELMMDKVGLDRLWPTQIVDAVHHDMMNAGELNKAGTDLNQQFLDSVFDVGMQHGLNQVMSILRFGVTTPFPAYHVRNLISDLIKSVQADSGVLFHPVANAKLTAAAFHRGKQWDLKIPGMEKAKVEDFLFVADMLGVRSGHHIAEVMNLLKSGKFTESTIKKHALNSWFAPGGKSTKFGASREDIVRYMTFLQGMRKYEGDAVEAAFQMTRHHFNYNDLTRVERRTMRNIFLFYTWYRKNIPLQLVELARRPGFFAGVAHTYNSLEEGQTPLNIGPFAGSVPKLVGSPDYIKNKLQAVTVNWKGYALQLGFGAPWSDLQWLSLEGLHDVPTMLTPLVVLPLGLDSRTDPLVGRRYKTYEHTGAAAVLGPIWKALTGSELPVDEKGRPTLDWRVTTLLRNLPLFGRGTAGFNAPSDVNDPGRLQTWGRRMNWLTGINVNVSPKPGSTREDLKGRRYVEGTIVQGILRQGRADLSNMNKNSDAYKKAMKAIQKKADAEAKSHNVTKYLTTTPQSGHYIKKSRKAAGGLGSSPFSGGLGKSVLP